MVKTVTQPRLRETDASGAILLSDSIAALSHALDLAEGLPEGHARRTCRIGMRLADEIGLAPVQRHDLFYALLLKDLGASAVATQIAALFSADERAVRREWHATDWSRASQIFRHASRSAVPGGAVVDRAFRVLGIGIRGRAQARRILAVRGEHATQRARQMGFSEATAEAISAAEERWDGQGGPHGRDGEAIPLLARVVALSQAIDTLRGTHGHETAYDRVWTRRGRWYDPMLVDALFTFRTDHAFWERLDRPGLEEALARVPSEAPIAVRDGRLDQIAAGFARVVDAKSTWTSHHSPGVAALAEGIALELGFPEQERQMLVRAALLHDLGKLGVSSHTLDRSGSLAETDRQEIRRHPQLSRQILSHTPAFASLADLAGAHHERLDGRGYPSGLSSDQLTLPMRALIVAEVAEALVADRPFRPALPPEKALAVMRRDVGIGLCPECFDGLERLLGGHRAPLQAGAS
jgi:putative nucleotidyltransferase with HDIG domain